LFGQVRVFYSKFTVPFVLPVSGAVSLRLSAASKSTGTLKIAARAPLPALGTLLLRCYSAPLPARASEGHGQGDGGRLG
jgi:hypothetical protein